MTTQTTISNRAWAELLLLGFIWGGSFLSIRIALDEITPIVSVLHRVGWAALVLWIIVALRREHVPHSLRLWGAFIVMGTLNNVIPFTLMAWGQLHIESGLTSIFNAATAIWSVLIAALFFADEQLSHRKLLGAMLGLAGVVIAIGIESLLNFDIRSLAQLAIMAGTVSYAAASVWAKKTLTDVSPIVAAAGMLTGSAIIMVPVTFSLHGKPSFNLNPVTWVAIFYYAIIATAFAYLLYYRVLAMAGSGNLMLVTLLIPPVAIVLGVWVLDETLLPQAYAGFALLALGLLIIDGRLFRRRSG
ncbi:MAG: DMT family transporter [Marinovum sp.]|nr:DMT family transporter [Marinovum sp.]